MSRLGQEIEQCMSALTEAEGNQVTARFLFPESFIGFQGHFPERPVLPAVCKVQAAIAVLAAWSKGGVRLDEIVSAKFLTPATCGQELVVQCLVAIEGGRQGLVRATVARNGESVAKFKLRVTFEEEERGRP